VEYIAVACFLPGRDKCLAHPRMWSEVNRTKHETRPNLHSRHGDELWSVVSDAWDEVASF
jgi:hypothetical protein